MTLARAARRIQGGLCALLLLFCWSLGHAQLARKPSYYEQKNQAARVAPQASAAPSAPQKSADSAMSSLAVLRNRADFDALARVYNPGTPMELPHLLFVIDRRAVPIRMDYINTPKFELHINFVRQTGLDNSSDKLPIDPNYLLPDRRFLFGTVSWQRHIGAFTYEFWEGDQLTPALLRQADAQVKASFFDAIRFKANSTLHERSAQQAGVEFVTQESLIKAQPYLPLNTGQAVGRVRVLAAQADTGSLTPNDIAVLRQVPLSLPPVAGLLTERASTALSHVNLLAKGWGVPNAFVRNAARVLAPYDGQWIELKVTASAYTVRRLRVEEISAFEQARARAQRLADASRQAALSSVRSLTSLTALTSAKPDLTEQRLLPLSALTTQHSAQCGAKAAHLGAIKTAQLVDTQVPDGFCIPFSHYQRFMQTHQLDARLARMQQLPGFATDARVRQTALARLRQDIIAWPVDAATAAQWRAQWQSQLQGGGVFVRSSSNSEDLPGFSGAGLYSTVPNVSTGDALELAVKQVWASVFNDAAWEARAAARFAQDAVLMGVLVQTAIDAQSAGVLITRDPFDPNHHYVTYISAKRGLGLRVVQGQRQAEQAMYSSWSKAVQILSRSADDTALQLNPDGGVKALALPVGQRVLTDALVVRLSGAGDAVKRLFGGVDQDIEWAISSDRIVLLQARPYVERAAPR